MSAKFQMRGRLGCFLLAGVIGTLHGSARAQTPEALRVERAAGAEDCPDAANLSERIATIRGRPDAPSSSNYEVGFSHTADTFSATIRSGPNGESQRVLEGRGLTCAALAQATAVTLALLFDSEGESAPPAKPEPEPPPPEIVTPPAEPSPPERPRSHAQIDSTLSLGAAGLALVLRPLSPAFTGELGLRVDGFRVGLGLLWNPNQTIALDPGQVTESLLSGTARTCVALTRARGLQFDVCSGVFVGAVTAQAQGFSVNQRRVRSWLAVPLELSLAELSGPVGWEVSASALGALVHQDFEVDGLGTAYHAPRVGGMLTFRAVGLWSW